MYDSGRDLFLPGSSGAGTQPIPESIQRLADDDHFPLMFEFEKCRKLVQNISKYL